MTCCREPLKATFSGRSESKGKQQRKPSKLNPKHWTECASSSTASSAMKKGWPLRRHGRGEGVTPEKAPPWRRDGRCSTVSPPMKSTFLCEQSSRRTEKHAQGSLHSLFGPVFPQAYTALHACAPLQVGVSTLRQTWMKAIAGLLLKETQETFSRLLVYVRVFLNTDTHFKQLNKTSTPWFGGHRDFLPVGLFYPKMEQQSRLGRVFACFCLLN